ncbi:MAG: 5'-nucleotidase, partial [Janthinobacterium lividum]
MAFSLDNLLVVGISSRALFDLEAEEKIFRLHGLQAYRQHQLDNESRTLKLGAGFALVRALLKLNELVHDQRFVEVVIMSRNSSETSMRIFNSIAHYGLDITRAALTGGASLAPYLQAFNVSLFLSLHEDDVQAAVDSGVASALLYQRPDHASQTAARLLPQTVPGDTGAAVSELDALQDDSDVLLPALGQIRIAFDGDAV